MLWTLVGSSTFYAVGNLILQLVWFTPRDCRTPYVSSLSPTAFWGLFKLISINEAFKKTWMNWWMAHLLYTKQAYYSHPYQKRFIATWLLPLSPLITLYCTPFLTNCVDRRGAGRTTHFLRSDSWFVTVSTALQYSSSRCDDKESIHWMDFPIGHTIAKRQNTKLCLSRAQSMFKHVIQIY